VRRAQADPRAPGPLFLVPAMPTMAGVITWLRRVIVSHPGGGEDPPFGLPPSGSKGGVARGAARGGQPVQDGDCILHGLDA